MQLGGSEGEDWTDEEDDDDSDIDLHPDPVADVEELAPLDSDLDFDEDDEDEDDDDDVGSESDADDDEDGHGDGGGAPFFPPHPDDWSDEGWDDAEGWEGEVRSPSRHLSLLQSGTSHRSRRWLNEALRRGLHCCVHLRLAAALNAGGITHRYRAAAYPRHAG